MSEQKSFFGKESLRSSKPADSAEGKVMNLRRLKKKLQKNKQIWDSPHLRACLFFYEIKLNLFFIIKKQTATRCCLLPNVPKCQSGELLPQLFLFLSIIMSFHLLRLALLSCYDTKWLETQAEKFLLWKVKCFSHAHTIQQDLISLNKSFGLSYELRKHEIWSCSHWLDDQIWITLEIKKNT